jgi:hypothetical protein
MKNMKSRTLRFCKEQEAESRKQENNWAAWEQQRADGNSFKL